MTTIPEPPEGTFVCWFDSFNDPYAVYYRTDQHDEATDEKDHWFSACQGGDDTVWVWADLVAEMDGWRGPVELVSAGELAGRLNTYGSTE